MDNLDWSNELEESLIMSRSNGVVYYSSNKKIESTSSATQRNGYNDLLFPNVFPQWNSRPCTLPNLQNGPVLEIGWNTGPIGPVKPAGSFESLDCLLSASPTHTTTSIEFEDDVFSDCKSMWNLNFNSKSGNFNSDLPELDRDRVQIAARSRYSDPPNPNKRKRGQNHSAEINEPKKARSEKLGISSSSNINFQQPSSSGSSGGGGDEPDAEAIAQMKEIIYRAAAFRPVSFAAEAVEKPRRKNVRISSDPQTVAARQRRERISERIRVLQNLVPGGSKMDTASMLDEAANYLKFLRSQVKALEAVVQKFDPTVSNASMAFSPFVNYSFSMQQQPQFTIHNPN